MKKFKLDANIGDRYSYDATFDDMELLVCNPMEKTFFIIEEEQCRTYTIEAESCEDALKKMLLHWYPNTYEEWKADADGDCSPCGIFHKADAYYTITEAETFWDSERIK